MNTAALANMSYLVSVYQWTERRNISFKINIIILSHTKTDHIVFRPSRPLPPSEWNVRFGKWWLLWTTPNSAWHSLLIKIINNQDLWENSLVVILDGRHMLTEKPKGYLIEPKSLIRRYFTLINGYVYDAIM